MRVIQAIVSGIDVLGKNSFDKRKHILNRTGVSIVKKPHHAMFLRRLYTNGFGANRSLRKRNLAKISISIGKIGALAPHFIEISFHFRNCFADNRRKQNAFLLYTLKRIGICISIELKRKALALLFIGCNDIPYTERLIMLSGLRHIGNLRTHKRYDSPLIIANDAIGNDAPLYLVSY